MVVLSLFDGMSCGQIALERAGIEVDNYYASEIDEYTIKVTMDNYPDTVQLGDVTKWKEWNLPEIDLLIGGGPCQGFSFAGKQLAFDDHRSKLFFEFIDVLKHVKPKYFLLENVRMKKKWLDIISKYIGVEPICINSNLVSAQNRVRYYWTNIPNIEQPEDKGILFWDILENDVDEKFFVKSGQLNWLRNFGEVKCGKKYIEFNPKTKTKTLTARSIASWNCTYLIQWPHGSNKGGYRGLDGKTPSLTVSNWKDNNYFLKDGYVRKLTPIECERLQTVPDNYTNAVSNSQRYKMLGNGWTVDVIAHIFKGLLNENL